MKKDLSIIIPFSLSIDDFKHNLPHNMSSFSDKRCEVIISLAEDSQKKELIKVLKEYKSVSWRVFCNNKRRYSNNEAINVALKHAKGRYVLVTNPNVVFHENIINDMLSKANTYSAVSTRVAWIDRHQFITGDLKKILQDTEVVSVNYGLFAPREALIRVKGYNESHAMTFKSDRDLKEAIKSNGIVVSEPIDPQFFFLSSSLPKDTLEVEDIKENNDKWGTAYNKLAYNNR